VTLAVRVWARRFLRQLFEAIPGQTWERVIDQWTVQILDWSASAAEDAHGQEETS
jgi:hypothetical protein